MQKSDPSRGPAVSTLKYLKMTENRRLKGAIDPFGARSTSRNVQNRLSTPRPALLQQALSVPFLKRLSGRVGSGEDGWPASSGLVLHRGLQANAREQFASGHGA